MDNICRDAGIRTRNAATAARCATNELHTFFFCRSPVEFLPSGTGGTTVGKVSSGIVSGSFLVLVPYLEGVPVMSAQLQISVQSRYMIRIYILYHYPDLV